MGRDLFGGAFFERKVRHALGLLLAHHEGADRDDEEHPEGQEEGDVGQDVGPFQFLEVEQVTEPGLPNSQGSYFYNADFRREQYQPVNRWQRFIT